MYRVTTYHTALPFPEGVSSDESLISACSHLGAALPLRLSEKSSALPLQAIRRLAAAAAAAAALLLVAFLALTRRWRHVRTAS